MEEESKNKAPEDTAVLQVMLEELSANQEAAGQQLTQLLRDVLVLSNQLNQLNQKPVSPLSPVQDQSIAVNAAIERGFNKHLANNPQMVSKTVKEFRILLFPEQDRKLFYKIVFGRWLLYLAIMLALNNFYKLAVHYSDNQKQIQIEKAGKSRLNWLWQYVYVHSDKPTKRLMEKAYNKSKVADTVLDTQ